MTANPGLVMVEEEDADDDSDSERLWANSARMASAMALPSMTFPRDADMAKKGSVVMQVDGGKVDDVGLEGGSLLS